MAIVVYKCDTCTRDIELVLNPRGLETIDRCIITQGCRGHLYRTEFHPDFVRGTLPDPVLGLDDWIQRKVLYNHTQANAREEWTVNHNLGTNPAISVFVDRPLPNDPANREEILPTDTTLVDPNTIKLQFDRPWSGIAQCVARSSDPDIISPAFMEEVTVGATQLTNDGELTIATKASVYPAERIGLQMVYSTITGTPFTSIVTFDSGPRTESPWNDYTRVSIEGKSYIVRSANVRLPEMIEGVIPDGSNFYFQYVIQDADAETLTFLPLNRQDVVVLLSGIQGTLNDKVFDMFFDISAVTPEENAFELAHDSGELFANQGVIETTFPPIQSAR